MRIAALFLGLIVLLGVGAFFGQPLIVDYLFRWKIDTLVQRNLPVGSSYTYKTATYDRAASRAVLTDVEVHGAGSSRFAAKIALIEIDGLSTTIDEDFAAALANPKLKPETWVPLADVVIVKGLSLDTDQDSVKVETVRATQIRQYPWAMRNVTQAAAQQDISQVMHATMPKQLSDFLPVVKSEAGLLLRGGIGSLTMENMEFSQRIGGARGTAVEVTKASLFQMDDSESGTLGSMVMKDLSIKKGAEEETSIDRLTITGLDVRNAAMRALTATSLDPSLLDGARLAKLEYIGMRTRQPDTPAVTADSIAISNVAFDHGMPVSADIACAGLRLRTADYPDAETRENYHNLGVETLTMSLSGGYRWDAGARTASLKDVSLKIDELGSLTVSADFSGVGRLTDLARTAALTHGTAQYTDGSLVGRMMALIAKSANITPAVLRQRMPAIVQQRSAALGTKPPVVAMDKTLVAFFNDPHRLTLEVAPAQPLTLAALDRFKTAPEQGFNALGLTLGTAP